MWINFVTDCCVYMQWHLLAAAATEMKSLTPLIIHHHSQARVWKEECCVHAEWFKL